jgi:hypothetical protein
MSYPARSPRWAASIVAARVGRGDVSSGGSLLMDAVAASLIGFAVLGLRRPNVLGTIARRRLRRRVLLNGLTMLNAPYYTQDFVKGVVLVGALALTFGLGKKNGKTTVHGSARRIGALAPTLSLRYAVPRSGSRRWDRRAANRGRDIASLGKSPVTADWHVH